MFALPSGALIGRVSTAAYPAGVQTTRTRLVWIAAKGLGAGANRDGPNPIAVNDDNLLKHPGTACSAAVVPASWPCQAIGGFDATPGLPGAR